MERQLIEKWQAFADAYYRDEGLRGETEADPVGVFRMHGFSVEKLPPTGIKVVANTEEVVYFVLPPDPNADLTDEDLLALSGGYASMSCLWVFP